MDQSSNHQAFVESLNWESSKNLVLNGLILLPTIVTSVTDGTILGHAYSSKESLLEAITQQKGIYYSRSRDELWVKSPSRVDGQILVGYSTDCDKDAIVFVVKQFGEFCHNHTLSCFDPLTNVVEMPTITIGFTYGHGLNYELSFFKSIGIHVTQEVGTKVKMYHAKSSLYDNIKLLPVKPKDIATFMEHGMIDVAVCFSDCMSQDSSARPELRHYRLLKGLISQDRADACKIKSLYAKDAPSVEIVAAVKKGFRCIMSFNHSLLSEYPEWTDSFSMQYEIDKFIPSHGNTERYIQEGMADVGIMVKNTGASLEDHGLEVLAFLETPKLGMHFDMASYSKFPRFFREVANQLDPSTILFYSVDGSHGYMSNFYPAKFVDSKGVSWNSSEHYYQAHKFADVHLFEGVRSQPTAKECYKFAYKHQASFTSSWELVKDLYMWEALLCKFDQNPDLMEKLKQTGDARLVEHALKDFHYGCGLDGSGKNHLGIMLEAIRAGKRTWDGAPTGVDTLRTWCKE